MEKPTMNSPPNPLDRSGVEPSRGPTEFLVDEGDDEAMLDVAKLAELDAISDRHRWLASVRTANGVSQTEMSQRLDRTQATMSSLESGVISDRQINTIAAYLDALGCDLELVARNRIDGTTHTTRVRLQQTS
jgi:DNA-binding XRE family transcriptional regulator